MRDSGGGASLRRFLSKEYRDENEGGRCYDHTLTFSSQNTFLIFLDLVTAHQGLHSCVLKEGNITVQTIDTTMSIPLIV